MTKEEETLLEGVLEAVELLGHKLEDTNAKLTVTDQTIADVKSLSDAELVNRERLKRSKRGMIVAICLIISAFVGIVWRSTDQVGCVVAWGQDVTDRNVSLSSPASLRVTDLYSATGASLRGVKLTAKERIMMLKDLETHRATYPGLLDKKTLAKSPDVTVASLYAIVQGQDQDTLYQKNTQKHPVPKLDCPFLGVS